MNVIGECRYRETHQATYIYRKKNREKNRDEEMMTNIVDAVCSRLVYIYAVSELHCALDGTIAIAGLALSSYILDLKYKYVLCLA